MLRPSNQTRAFTLIELLVVISIIIILVGLLFPAFKGVQDQAKRVQAKNDLTQLATAVGNFYNEYGKYPVKQGSTGDCEYNTDNDQLLNVLRAVAAAGTYQGDLNPRKVQFIQVATAKDTSSPKSGLNTTGVYFDPWGTAYRVKMDGDYDNVVGNPYSSNAGNTSLELGTIAWSLGKDGTGGTGDKKTGTNDDDILSWQ